MDLLKINEFRDKFKCRCGCGLDLVDYSIYRTYIDILYLLKKTLIIHSGCRCLLYNKKVGGKEDSYHLKGQALDFHLSDIPNKTIYYELDKRYKNKFGIFLYDWGIHIDIREKEGRGFYV